MSKPENPPLFDSDGYVSLDGITLHDLFVAAALTGILSDQRFDHPPEEYAERSFRMADAVLAEREKRDAE